LNEEGQKIIDFKVNNLHVVGYSIPVNEWMELEELQKHLHSIESQPNAIPYVTSYYKEYWGICLSHRQRMELKPGKYFVCINSSLKKGSLAYGEYLIKGSSEKEIFLSTYVCHPSMASNELSGPAVVTQLVKWLASEKRKYSYRIVFIPETIGSVTYLSLHHEEMKRKVIAGFNVSCVGDNHNYSYVKSRYGNTFADRIMKRILSRDYPGYKEFSFLERGSDERQYCSPGIDLPLVGFCRTKYEEYPEYHTSFDNLSYICEEGLTGALGLLKKVILHIENIRYYRIKTLCEPQLGKRNLYPVLSTKTSVASVKRMMNFIAYSDGKNDLEDIADITGIPLQEISEYLELLKKEDLIEEIDIIK
jgi:aminopeptidase-like protein